MLFNSLYGKGTYEYEHKASSLLDSEDFVHSFRDVFGFVCLRRIQ